jgi:pimeloyl-ACP methyl ester carboxylesterase
MQRSSQISPSIEGLFTKAVQSCGEGLGGPFYLLPFPFYFVPYPYQGRRKHGLSGKGDFRQQTVDSHQIRLPDGRRLAYVELGRPDGGVVVYCHGWPGSRLEATLFVETAENRGVRLLSVDRPGMGLSDFQSGRRVSDWPQDLGFLLQHLNIDRFAVIGVSGGSPYAVACASGLSDRVESVAIVGGVAPFEPDLVAGLSWWHRWMLRLEHQSPPLACLMFSLLSRVLVMFPLTFLRFGRCFLSPPDRTALSNPKVKNLFPRLTREAFRNGIRGPLLDGRLYSEAWGVPTDQIRAPVFLWHGQADTIIPASMSEVLLQHIPEARLRILRDEGHLSLPLKHFPKILDSVLQVDS